MGIIEGASSSRVAKSAGAPGAGTSEVQTITIGGTPTGGSFKLSFDGYTTAAIEWDAVNNTLRDNVDAALEALPSLGTGSVATAVGTMTDGIGTLTVTFASKRVEPLIAVASNDLEGTDPTVEVAETTPGVTAFGAGTIGKGELVADVTNGKLYINTGTAAAPTWTVVGSQS